jgi:glycine betaine transporter
MPENRKDERRTFPDAVLVCIDFSLCSLRALEAVLQWRASDTEVTLLHVVDTEFIGRVERSGIYSSRDLNQRMRSRAIEDLDTLISKSGAAGLEPMVVEGVPFVEIVKIANDLDCNLIVLGRAGIESGPEQILFGGMAEKVLRGTRLPVLCVP